MDADGDKPLEDQLEDLGNDIENYASFHRTETGSSSTRALGATLNIGADYVFPLYDNCISVSCLPHASMANTVGVKDGISANVTPVKWFDAGVNYGISSFGSSFGWILTSTHVVSISLSEWTT